MNATLHRDFIRQFAFETAVKRFLEPCDPERPVAEVGHEFIRRTNVIYRPDFSDLCTIAEPYRGGHYSDVVVEIEQTAEWLEDNLFDFLMACDSDDQRRLERDGGQKSDEDQAATTNDNQADHRDQHKLHHEFAFDITLNSVARVCAANEQDARDRLTDLDCLDLTDVEIPGDTCCPVDPRHIRLTEASLATDTDAPALFEIDRRNVDEDPLAFREGQIGSCALCGGEAMVIGLGVVGRSLDHAALTHRGYSFGRGKQIQVCRHCYPPVATHTE